MTLIACIFAIILAFPFGFCLGAATNKSEPRHIRIMALGSMVLIILIVLGVNFFTY